MESKEKRYLKLLDGLKANNISSNIPSLKNASNQIVMLIENLPQSQNSIINENIKKGIESLDKTQNEKLNIDDRISYYIDFGNTFQSILSFTDNLEPEKFKNIAKEYLKIANILDDTRVTNIAIDIAKTLKSKESPQ